MTLDKYLGIPSPTYILEEAKLERNLEVVSRVMRETDVEIILALKGFSMWSAFDILQKHGIRTATASSLNEARLTVEYFGKKAHSYSPVYLPEEFAEQLTLSSHITFNSLSELERYRAIVLAHDEKVSMGLRVNPEYSVVETPLYDPTVPGTRLGVEAALLRDGLPKGVEGLHFHNLCESGAQDLKNTFEKVEQLYGHLLKGLKWVNVGGGHLMTRKGYDVELLIDTLNTFKKKHNLQVIMEPGSAFAWDCGPLAARVLDIVTSGNIQTAMLDISFTAHLPDTLEMPYRPKVLNASEKGAYAYRLGGVSCLAGDYLDTYCFDNPLEIGDTLYFDDMIHYTMVKTTMFNGVKHPNIGILRTNGTFDLIRTFTYEDYKQRLS